MQLRGGALLPARYERPGVQPQRGLLVSAEAGTLNQLEIDVIDRVPVAHPRADLAQDRGAHSRLPSGMPVGASLTKRPASAGPEHARARWIDSARGTPGWSWLSRCSAAPQFGQRLSAAALYP